MADETELSDVFGDEELDNKPVEEQAVDPVETGENEPSAPPADEAPPVKTQPTVPLAAIEDERRKRQSLEAQLEETNAQLRRLIDGQQGQPELPDPYADPEGFAAHQAAQQEFAMRNAIAHLSEKQMRRAVGNEIVDAALEAARAAGVTQEFFNAADPYGDLVDWHKAQQVQNEIGNNPAAYRQRVRSEIEAEVLKKYGLAPQQPVNPSNSSARPPQSLASMPSTTGAAPRWGGPTPLDDLLD